MSATTCSNCGETCGPDDVFCEACGFDFVTGSAPGEQARPPSLVNTGPAAPVLVIEITADRAYFDEVVTEGEIDFPDPEPEPQRLEVPGPEVHIGRTSESRAVHPDIDVADLTGDPAVSTRHAVLRIVDDVLTVLDVGSTNGTFLAAPDSTAIAAGEAAPLEPDEPVYVGAWTKLVVVEVKQFSD